MPSVPGVETLGGLPAEASTPGMSALQLYAIAPGHFELRKPYFVGQHALADVRVLSLSNGAPTPPEFSLARAGECPAQAHPTLRLAPGAHEAHRALCGLGDAGVVYWRVGRAQRDSEGRRPVRRVAHGGLRGQRAARRGVPRPGLHQLHPLVRAGRELLLVPARPRRQGDRRPAGLPPEPRSFPDRRQRVQRGQRLGLAECGQQRRSAAGPGAARPEGAAACRPARPQGSEPAARTCASTWRCKGRRR